MNGTFVWNSILILSLLVEVILMMMMMTTTISAWLIRFILILTKGMSPASPAQKSSTNLSFHLSSQPVISQVNDTTDVLPPSISASEGPSGVPPPINLSDEDTAGVSPPSISASKGTSGVSPPIIPSGEDTTDVSPPVISMSEGTPGVPPPIIPLGKGTTNVPLPVNSSGDNLDNPVNFNGGLLDLLYERYGFLNPGSDDAVYESTFDWRSTRAVLGLHNDSQWVQELLAHDDNIRNVQIQRAISRFIEDLLRATETMPMALWDIHPDSQEPLQRNSHFKTQRRDIHFEGSTNPVQAYLISAADSSGSWIVMLHDAATVLECYRRCTSIMEMMTFLSSNGRPFRTLVS